MEWILIIEAIFKMIQECQDNRSRRDIEAGMNNPGVRERWAIRKVVRKEWNLRGRKLWEKVDEGMDELRDLDVEDIQVLMSSVPSRLT